jgi:hypothetical protein
VTRCATGVVTLVVVLATGACGTTYLDADVTVAPTASTPSTTQAAVSTDAPVGDLLAQMESLMLHLDEDIVDRSAPEATLARLEDLWAVAERQIRRRDPDDLYPYEQAMTLARSGVERNRPADASKGYKLLVTAIAAESTL